MLSRDVASVKRELLLLRLRGTARPQSVSHGMAPIERADRSGLLPLSWSQQRLWFLDQLEGAAAAYHIAGGVRLQGKLDRQALRVSLDRVVARHEALRTRFEERDGEAVQVIGEAEEFALQECDLRDLPPLQQEEQVQRQAQEEAQGRFDLSRGPLVRGRLLRLAEEEHVLLVVMHHIVSDGWSLGVLIEEVVRLYGAYSAGGEDPLPGLPIQYADYAQWQRRWLQGELLQEELRYWKERLSGAPALLQLPTDRGRPAVQSYRGESVEVVIGKRLSEQLRQLSRRMDMTLFMTLYTGYALVLSRLSGQEDVVIGVPVANRTRREVEGLIGFFVNTLALRTQVRGEQRVSDLLEQVRGVTLESYAHQQVPFEQVVEGLQPPRSLGHSPVFQVLFALQNTPRGTLGLSGLRVSEQRVTSSAAQFDLSLSLQDDGERISGALNYASDLFDRQTMQRWAGYLHRALESMVGDADQAVGEMELLEESEREQLLEEFNATAVEYPQEKLIHELFEEQARRTPDAVAVVYEGQSLTYGQLNGRANQLAHYLIERGIGPDERVGICVERSVEMVVGLLGILKAGGAYVPLDPSYPVERLTYMLGDAQPKVLLSQQRLKGDLPQTQAEVIALDDDWSEIARQPCVDLDPTALGLKSHNLAYVIYTSGSTGQPKGVMVEQGGLLNYLHWVLQCYGVEGSEGSVVSSSIAFDATVTSLWSPLLSGQTVFLLREGEEIEGLRELVRGPKRLGVVKISPAHLHALGQGWPAGEPCGVGVFVIGGEALSGATVRMWQGIAPRSRLINEYGPTETVVGCSTYEVPEGWEPTRAVPIGRPISNTRIYILDGQRQLVPVGVVGEIYIGGAGVARGYLNRPELTAERFLRDPFSAEAQARMYRSGDLGRWRADGTIEYLGRNDHQVKIRGYRIELGEIESQLRRHPQVRDAVVLALEGAPHAAHGGGREAEPWADGERAMRAQPDEPGDKRLVAYVTGPQVGTAVEQLSGHLQEVLPEYMVPRSYVVLESMPLTANGKLDRQGLPAPDDSARVQRQYAAPEGPIEEALARIWQELLHVERVGRQDNFFELGGHSLRVVQLIERLRQAGIQADIHSIFTSPTLMSLAQSLGGVATPQITVPANLIPAHCEAITPAMLTLVQLDESQIERIVQSVPGGAKNIQDIYPLAPLQEGILFHHLLNEDRDVYVQSMLLTVQSRALLESLLEAIQRVIDRHDILRSAVLWQDLPRPVQVVHRKAMLPVHELSLDPTMDALVQMRARMTAKRQHIPLTQAPLMRMEIGRDPDSLVWYALLVVHHIVGDHISMQTKLAEVGYFREGEVELPAAGSYREYVGHALEQARGNEAEIFFRSKLGDVDEVTAPFGLLNVHGDGSEAIESHQEVDAVLARRIRWSARSVNVSPAILFHAACSVVVARCSGRDDVVFGSVLSGRLQGTADTTRTVGMLINTLPLRISLQGVSARELVGRVQDELSQLLKHEQAALSLAQRCSGLRASAPLFSAVLNYRHGHRGDLQNQQSGMHGIEVVASQAATNYPLLMSVDDWGEGFTLSAQTEQSIEPSRVTGYLHRVLEGLVEALESAPERLALELPVLPESERDQLLEEFNATAVEYPQGKLIHELFEEQARRTPDAVAVVYEGQSLTYGQLNGRANQLAHYLIELGIGPDERVGICVERSVEMVVGLLGILKAGGAYVPLDPGYPAERLAYMLGDAQPKVLLSQQRLKGDLPRSRAEVIALDDDWSEIARRSPDNLEAATLGLRPDHLAYVIYTSGSTGQPKGTAMAHHSLVNLIEWHRRGGFPNLTPRTLQYASLSFDVAFQEVFSTICVGASLILMSEAVRRDPRRLCDLLELAAIERVFLPFVALQQVVACAVASARTLPRLRNIITAGERLRITPVIRSFFSQHAHARLHNHYGPTETHVVTAHTLPAEVGEWEALPTIGRPIANVQIYILNDHGQLVPRGVAGEIHIGGAGVAREYLNRARLTIQRFVREPLNPQRLLFKSGDLGFWRDDGTIEFLGRNDHQVKIRGHRVELGEIEARLAQLPQVGQVAVVAQEDRANERRLVAYFTAAPAASPDALLLRDHLRLCLPEYMIPAAFVRLQSLPLTSNGKLDHRALPTAESHSRWSDSSYEAPEGEIEIALARIWSEILRVAQVDRRDSFFELGGDSLLAVQLINRISMDFKCEPCLKALFDHVTLVDQGEYIQTLLEAKSVRARTMLRSGELLQRGVV